MQSNYTKCPNCSQQSVAEYDNCFQCFDCGNWGYSRGSLPYRKDQSEFWNQDGQVCRKPRAA